MEAAQTRLNFMPILLLLGHSAGQDGPSTASDLSTMLIPILAGTGGFLLLALVICICVYCCKGTGSRASKPQVVPKSIKAHPLIKLSEDGRRKLEKEVILQPEDLFRLNMTDILKLSLKIGDKNRLLDLIPQLQNTLGQGRDYLVPEETDLKFKDANFWENLSGDGRCKLRDEMIITVADVLRLREEDIQKMNLKIGDKNRVMAEMKQNDSESPSGGVYQELVRP